MPTDFTLPELGENVTAGDVIRVLVSSGDTLAKDQPVLELETDKATIEVPSSVSGTVKDVRVKQGERVKVGQVVLTVDEAAGKAPAKESKQGAAAKKESATGDAPKKQPVGAPDAGGLSQAAPGEAGGSARADDKRGGRKGAVERSRGAVTSEADERRDGTAVEEGEQPEEQDAAAPQKPRGEVVEISRGSRGTPAGAQTQPQAEAAEPEAPLPPAAPSVRRLARELGVDIRRVSGTGPDRRISAEDVQAYVRNAMGSGMGAAQTAGPPDLARWGDVERKPMSNVRRKTAEHLSRAWNVIPHVTQHDKADVTGTEALRRQYGGQAEKAGGKLTITAIALKIADAALRRFPQFNASIDPARNEIIYRKSVHIGVAVDTERGLLVPVIRDVDRKGIIQLSVELTQASEKARAGKLSLDDMQGGGFTITNLGGIGGTSFTPIVNWPEVAILGMSRSVYEPVWRPRTGSGAAGFAQSEEADTFEPRLMLPLSLSYDHRVIDGADAARFLRWVAEAFEQPFVMSL